MTTAVDLNGVSESDAIEMHRVMVTIRVFESRVEKLFLAGELPGFVHLYLGQEAIAAGVCRALKGDDFITSTHRGHGHAIAKGMDLAGLMAELFGREAGACRGRGGSMHVADFSLGMLGANGIVGGGLGIAAGAGLSARYRKSGQVAVAFFGDGGINKGTFHESLNFAAVHKLPVVFVCENNQFAQFTARHKTTSVEDLAMRATAYGIPGLSIDGNDAALVYRTTSKAVLRARSGEGPTLLNMLTYRWGGHYVGDAEVYREREEVEHKRSDDPIARLETALRDLGWLSDSSRNEVWARIETEVEEAERFARDSPAPDPADALDFVFTSGAPRG